MTKTYSVTVQYKDEVIEQDTFTDEDDAQNCFDDAENYFYLEGMYGAVISLLEGEVILDLHVTEDPAKFEAEWRREQAMEAGMLHGIDAYNEVMGY